MENAQGVYREYSVIGTMAIILLCLLLSPDTVHAQAPAPAAQRPAVFIWPRSMIPVHAVVVFTRFKGEAPTTDTAPYWAADLFSGEAGSVNHYFSEISFGRIQVTGEYLPRMYEMPHESRYYIDNLTQYSLDLLQLLDDDPEVDFSRFDNDGPDRIPGSSDDDGWVDYLILMPRTRPTGFIKGLATGNATLRMGDTFFSRDRNSEGFLIKADTYSGCIATAKNYKEALGTIVAEISHAYGTDDLMDKNYTDPATDSAGVGNWDILGWGALGWDGNSYPVGPNAFQRWIMGCVGISNDGVIDLYGIHQNVRVKPIGKRDGTLYRIWISEDEYFMIENRRNDSFLYDQQIPGSGLMIWHIHEPVSSNDNELFKMCDLECPDGRYLDKGYPLGVEPDPVYGGDNLDFWAHDEAYAVSHGGNAGDATDIFDGEVYTEFGSNTNPNTWSKETKKPTGIEIFNIRRDGEDMLFDCITAPLAPWFDIRFPLVGAGVQRFSAPDIYPRRTEKTVYAVFSGNTPSPDKVVVLENNNLTVRTMNGIDNVLVERMIAEEFITADATGSRIERRSISLGEFIGELDVFGLELADIMESDPAAIVRVSRSVDDQVKPGSVKLMQNFPNPFNASTTIPYMLTSGSEVSLEVYNVLGQRVITLDQGYREAGIHEVRVDADGLSSGMYFYRLGGLPAVPSKRFLLIK